MRYLVFVYGTLKKGFRLHRYLKDAKFLGKACLSGYDMYDLGWYPGIVPGPGTVYGEVYEIDLKTLFILDEVEDEGQEYERKILPVKLEDGKVVHAFVYVYKGPVENKLKVKDGLWLKK
ncbi:gamma-glutamylcyclotransferase family protein [Thermodesulfatator indicus]